MSSGDQSRPRVGVGVLVVRDGKVLVGKRYAPVFHLCCTQTDLTIEHMLKLPKLQLGTLCARPTAASQQTGSHMIFTRNSSAACLHAAAQQF
jgi:hypothetical protein